MRNLFLYRAPVALFMAFVFFVSTRQMPEGPPLFWQADKLFHFVTYFMLALLWARALGQTIAPQKAFFRAVFIAFFYGVFIEVWQSFVPERSAEVFDAAANGAGGLGGAYTYGLIARTKLSKGGVR